ncbi:peptide-methionine (S)-S-oxide reductase [Candidatus Giovannonibacteria bacterium RIFCSPLOWO2_01_FULL_46_13]|uniref:Peptide methionine sulfoxide reductase MsrA n=1 Tax=Candidatus Giovannonibacteria bacterium RIFCSPLOWO2_01_FULL_46_13 TaxID=1798352 RepID=A0A1F5X648_9BACT|nr:MAG: peptide-methionine (S)-S-oxide reductase [Candidatus Giovannonibacteria bacterium RIFCSPLOWO2_01_FULL_46_13]
MDTQKEIAVFGGGCFWCTEAVFQMLKGINKVLPGYSGGSIENPTYEQVSSGKTGHAEVIYIEYDPAQISYRNLLAVFFGSHDPTTKNRQGSDVGPQYRSVIFHTTPGQKSEAEKIIKEINGSDSAGAPVVTEIEPFTKFYEAEDYHKNFYERNRGYPYCEVIINPKLEKVQHEFAELLKKK